MLIREGKGKKSLKRKKNKKIKKYGARAFCILASGGVSFLFCVLFCLIIKEPLLHKELRKSSPLNSGPENTSSSFCLLQKIQHLQYLLPCYQASLLFLKDLKVKTNLKYAKESENEKLEMYFDDSGIYK